MAAVGTAPPGTSERSTTSPRASRLRTTGLYSVVRHPLYLGNTLTAVGLACFTTTWYVPGRSSSLLAMLYHERIAAREEVFLEERFGDEFVRWADRVPAILPRPSGYVRGETPFLWRRVAGREFHGLFVIGAALFVARPRAVGARHRPPRLRPVLDRILPPHRRHLHRLQLAEETHERLLKVEEESQSHAPAFPRSD